MYLNYLYLYLHVPGRYTVFTTYGTQGTVLGTVKKASKSGRNICDKGRSHRLTTHVLVPMYNSLRWVLHVHKVPVPSLQVTPACYLCELTGAQQSKEVRPSTVPCAPIQQPCTLMYVRKCLLSDRSCYHLCVKRMLQHSETPALAPYAAAAA